MCNVKGVHHSDESKENRQQSITAGSLVSDKDLIHYQTCTRQCAEKNGN